MGVITSQQLSQYYDIYRDSEVVFTKEIIRALNFDQRQVSLRCNGSQWPCILNSISFMNAKIILSKKSTAFSVVEVPNPPTVTIRFCFIQAVTQQTLPILISARVGEIEPYQGSDDLSVVTLNFLQRPADDFIEILGRLHETNQNYIRKKDDRVIISDNSKRRLKLSSEETLVYIQNVPRHCILRDIAFTSAKIILIGVSQFLVNKAVALDIMFVDPDEKFVLKGIVSKADSIEGRKDLIIAQIDFSESEIPLSFKLRVNDFISQARLNQIDGAQKAEEK